MSDHVREKDAVGSRALVPALRGPGDQVTGGLPWSRLRRVVSYVQENLAGELRLAELSALVHMSPFHFARLFRKSTGVTPRDTAGLGPRSAREHGLEYRDLAESGSEPERCGASDHRKREGWIGTNRRM